MVVSSLRTKQAHHTVGCSGTAAHSFGQAKDSDLRSWVAAGPFQKTALDSTVIEVAGSTVAVAATDTCHQSTGAEVAIISSTKADIVHGEVSKGELIG